MIQDYGLPLYFWAEATQTACYIINRVSIRPIIKKTPYELFREQTPNLAHLRPFGCKCYILNTGSNLDKFDAKSDLGIFVGYSPHSKAYRVFNRRTLSIQESIHVEFDEKKSATKHVAIENDNAGNDDDFEEHVNSNEQSEENELVHLRRKMSQHFLICPRLGNMRKIIQGSKSWENHRQVYKLEVVIILCVFMHMCIHFRT